MTTKFGPGSATDSWNATGSSGAAAASPPAQSSWGGGAAGSSPIFSFKDAMAARGFSSSVAPAKSKDEASMLKCIRPAGWTWVDRVAINKAGALDCHAKCREYGFKFFGFTCPGIDKSKEVVCQCSQATGGSNELDSKFCEGKGKPLVHPHSHCIGPYAKDGFSFGDFGVGSVYDARPEVPGREEPKKAGRDNAFRLICDNGATGCMPSDNWGGWPWKRNELTPKVSLEELLPPESTLLLALFQARVSQWSENERQVLRRRCDFL